MLSEALRPNAKHEARLSNISGLSSLYTDSEFDLRLKAWPRTSSAALQLRMAQNDILSAAVIDSYRLTR
jgi:hypothetical protein